MSNRSSMLNRCQIDPWGGEGEEDSRVGSGGPVPNKPLPRPGWVYKRGGVINSCHGGLPKYPPPPSAEKCLLGKKGWGGEFKKFLPGHETSALEVSEMASAKTASAIVSVSTMWRRYWNSVSASLLERILLGFASPCGFRGRYWISVSGPYRR